jgi:hypothetical protein
LGRLERHLARHDEPDDDARPEACAQLVREYVEVRAVITSADRLHLFAGEGEEGYTAPASIRADPERMLEWCRRYEPESVLDEQDAWIAALNRTHGELVGRFRAQDPKALPDWSALAHFIEYADV